MESKEKQKKNNTNIKEYRTNITDIIIRNLNENNDEDNNKNEMVIEGYAVVFGKVQKRGWLTEVIENGAFDNADMSDVCLRYNHSNEYPILARTRNKSLILEVDDKGLKVIATLIETTDNRNIYERVKAGLLDKMSFAFTVRKREWEILNEDTENEESIQHIIEIDKLFDVSIVDEPFYEDTEVSARGLEGAKQFKEKRDEEKLMIEKEKLRLKLLLV